MERSLVKLEVVDGRVWLKWAQNEKSRRWEPGGLMERCAVWCVSSEFAGRRAYDRNR